MAQKRIRRREYWHKRADKGISYVISNIDFEECRAIIQKMVKGFPTAEYRITYGECDCKGFRYRGSCAHVNFLSCLVDGKTATEKEASLICSTIVHSRQFKKYKAEIIEREGKVELLHIRAEVPDLPTTRVVEWYSGLPVITDINMKKGGAD